MKVLIIIGALLLQCMVAVAQNSGNDLKISILTCAYGKEIYSAFGHSAFRVQSKSRRIDKVYNYGTFNYHQQFFVLKFVRGFLDYAVQNDAVGNTLKLYERAVDNKRAVAAGIDIDKRDHHDKRRRIQN